MKFLCVSCDEAMKLIDAKPPERGSLTVVYRCMSCNHEIAMLTNPFETQVVGSLGVKVGSSDTAETDGESKCPFSGLVADMGVDMNADAGIPWTSEATSRLENIPEFARPMAKTGIEKFAEERGVTKIDAQVLEQAKDFFGM